jgi:hypothetical protein
VRNVYLGSTRKMAWEQAITKAGRMKVAAMSPSEAGKRNAIDESCLNKPLQCPRTAYLAGG